jgi:type II secretory pathway component PulC
VLVGVVTSADQRIALLRGGNGKTVTLSEGQSLDGWILHTIQPGHVRVTTDGAAYDLVFPVTTGSPGMSRPRR